eukprot:1242988-Pleurochrysis_carterae.AAC.1
MAQLTARVDISTAACRGRAGGRQKAGIRTRAIRIARITLTARAEHPAAFRRGSRHARARRVRGGART